MTKEDPYAAIENPFWNEINPIEEYLSQADPLRIKPEEGPRMPSVNKPRSIMIFSPHPDDESIIGGLALRAREEEYRIVNVAVTQGSNPKRQEERLQELRDACQYLGFSLHPIPPRGLEGVNMTSRRDNAKDWMDKVQEITEIIDQHNPFVLMFPHENDWNSTHVGVNALVRDALAYNFNRRKFGVVETEFWQQMENPNLMVELSQDQVATLVAAISLHKGEVERNPYHRLLPFQLGMDVVWGAEKVGSQGARAPNMSFATLYRAGKWDGKKIEPAYEGGRFLTLENDVSSLLESLVE